jgi:hypothetical protein
MIFNKDFNNIQIVMFNQEEKIFSGQLNDLADFIKQPNKADRVEVYNTSGSAVASMGYGDFKMLLEDQSV